VATIVDVVATSEVVPDSARVTLKDGIVHLRYGTRSRTYKAGDLIPACVMPVPLTFEVSGLLKQDYRVAVSEIPFYSARPYIYGLAIAFVLLASAGIALRRWRRQGRPRAS